MADLTLPESWVLDMLYHERAQWQARVDAGSPYDERAVHALGRVIQMVRHGQHHPLWWEHQNPPDDVTDSHPRMAPPVSADALPPLHTAGLHGCWEPDDAGGKGARSALELWLARSGVRSCGGGNVGAPDGDDLYLHPATLSRLHFSQSGETVLVQILHDAEPDGLDTRTIYHGSVPGAADASPDDILRWLIGKPFPWDDALDVDAEDA